MDNIEPKVEQREKLRNATLVYLIRESANGISEVCLAMKKRGFGVGRWNAVGGKVEPGETIQAGATREAKEEIDVQVTQSHKVGDLAFAFPHRPDWDQRVHVYLADAWEGEPTESEEMKPGWFPVDNLPLESMWSSDVYWLPEVLAGKLIVGDFVFGEGDVVISHEAQIVETL